MRLDKKKINILLILFSIIIFLTASFCCPAYAESEYLYLGGFPAGFTLNTQTVEVIGFCDVVTNEGMCSPARESGVKTGDIVKKINGIDIKSTSDINKILSVDYKKYEITIMRDNEEQKMEINPVNELTSNTRKLGILVKDSLSGIGTVTYIDRNNNKFASLGHPVSDQNGNLLDINGGTVYNCLIYDIKKGVRGTPGELRGVFENCSIIGQAKMNCSCGIYGILNDKFDYTNLIKIEKGSINDVKIGKACIYTSIYGNTVQKFDISIVKTDKENKENRNYVIKIEDDKLIEYSGGIVQGMSGSPIVQDGKIVGAVTHVFVNDPTRGYGISIDNMLKAY